MARASTGGMDSDRRSEPVSTELRNDGLERLRTGNDRFVQGRSSVDWTSLPAARAETASGQAPFAVILTCSDSRVPTEMVFDQGIGDLFVVRVAGNVVSPEVIGSVEFAVAALGSRIVVSMGHSTCGAVSAAVDQVLEPETEHTDALQMILDGIRPSVEATRKELGAEASDRDTIVDASIREHARASAQALVERSPLLKRSVVEDGLAVVAAEYELSSGRVTFL